DVELELDTIQLPAYALPKGETNETYLKKLCVKGLERRYDRAHTAGARERLDYELGVVTQMGLSSYFLIVQDFVNWAKGQGSVVGPGRGSAAGSIVSYLLNITNLDPIAYNLLFERFLAPGRIQMPDIDIDFADHRRDEVIRYVKQRYGEDRVAQIITFGTMAARASVRDVGRVLDVPYAFCDRLAKLIPLHASLDEAVRDVDELRELSEADETTQRLLAIAKRLEGAARHTSTHACGVVITAEPLVASVPLQRASADDATIITQYEMHAVENLGLLKMDFLGLSNLSIIEHAVNIIRERGTAIDIEQLPLDDAPTFALLQAGETTGVFQLESGGMKRYLKDLKPSQFEDIIAMVALYRPGPMELIPEYIDRKFGRKPIAYLHPKLETVLKNTYGIMVYQEQLMQLARELAGFTMAQADTLRKAVGKKIKKLLDEQRAKLIEGMVGNKIPEKTAKKIWEWIEPFARYGFNRSHAACYALIAYQTAYLKAHYPAEFMAALLTAERGDTDRLAVLIQECREMEIAVLGPDINESDVLFTVVDDDGKSAIRFGLAAIKNVGEHLVEMLVAERKANGPYPSLEDLCARTKDKDFNKKSLECIIKSGCLECFGERGQLLAAVETILTYHRAIAREAEIGQESLFQSSGKRTPLIIPPSEPAAQRMRLAWEKELLGLYLSSHPFESTAKAIGSSIISIADLKKGSGDQQGIFGGVITRMKRIVTKKGDGMLFAELEDHTGNIEVVVFPRVLTATAPAWIAETTILVRGKRSDRDGEVKMLADHVVQVVPGREAEALRSVGGSTVNPYAPPRDEPMRPVTFQLPAALPPERLRDLRTFLERSPGTVPVRLRSVDGRLVSTGVRIAWTPELRAGVEEILGVGTVREEVAEVVP
ncbi:MAG: DNA polymerase III subunit alpha, partial [bacterium]|nr:DNA polymerase III subunit alpha [bacterium]